SLLRQGAAAFADGADARGAGQPRTRRALRQPEQGVDTGSAPRLGGRCRRARELAVPGGSLSKVWSPGLRIGWMIGPAELLAKATMCKQFSDAHTSTFAQATAAQYLKSGRMPGTLAHVREVYAERAAAMGEALSRELGDAIAFTQPGGGLFFWARLTGANGKIADANVLAKRAIEKLVAFVPGAPFFAEEHG